MDVDVELLHRFEEGLIPQAPERSVVTATLLGYGEISAIFQIGDDSSTAYKRLPLFSDKSAAEHYAVLFETYCSALTEAGLTLPDSATVVVEVPGRPVCLYIAQAQFPQTHFAHTLIHTQTEDETEQMISRVCVEISKVWAFNSHHKPKRELAIDGQLSNWVCPEESDQPLFIDTSTPLLRLEGKEQFDPELVLQAAPSFLRWLLRWLFLQDVLNRYYDPREVYIDVAANLYKEQRQELIEPALGIINLHIPDGIEPITEKNVIDYYKQDKLIWSLFLSFRRVDRWMTTKLLHKRYEFILPGKIKR